MTLSVRKFEGLTKHMCRALVLASESYSELRIPTNSLFGLQKRGLVELAYSNWGRTRCRLSAKGYAFVREHLPEIEKCSMQGRAI